MGKNLCMTLLAGLGAACAGVVAAGAIGTFYYCSVRYPESLNRENAEKIYRRNPKLRDTLSDLRAMGTEEVSIVSLDRLKLVGYYLPAEEPTDKFLILMHGYRSPELVDFAHLYRFYHDLGYNLLVPFERAHGESEGMVITYGAFERYDLLGWTEYLIKRFGDDVKIYWSGISMGCATVLLASAMDLPVNVKAVIGDCGYTSPHDMFEKVANTQKYPWKKPAMVLAELLIRLFGGYDPKKLSVTEAMRNCKIPALFIHGSKDRFVPCEMTIKNHAACCAPKELLIVENAEHANSCVKEPELYRNTVKAFLEKYQ